MSRRKCKPLPGGGELTLLEKPSASDLFVRAMELRRGSEDEPMDELAAAERLQRAGRQGHYPAMAALALFCEGKVRNLPRGKQNSNRKSMNVFSVEPRA